MRNLLALLFGVIFVCMIFITVQTSIQMPIWEAFSTFGDNPWVTATLWDAYFGFLTFYVWVAWKETRIFMKLIWFILIMALGNIAMSLYILIQLKSLSPLDSPALLLSKRNE